MKLFVIESNYLESVFTLNNSWSVIGGAVPRSMRFRLAKVTATIKDMKRKKSPDSDDISTRMIKNVNL